MKRLIIVGAGVALALAAACGGKEPVTAPTGETAQRGTTTAAPSTATLEVAPRTSTPVIAPTVETSPLPATPVSTAASALATYRSDQFGFEFQYRSECTLTEQPDGASGIGGGSVYLSVTVGSRLELHVSDPGGLSLADYVKRTDDQLEARGASIEPTSQAGPVGGAESMTVRYSFGGPGRYGEATFFERNGRIYDVGFTAGAFTCSEPQVYEGILSTFRFTGESTIVPTPQAQTAVTTEYGIYVVRPDGSGLRALGPVGWGVWNHSWSPDGKRIAFVRTDCVTSTVFVGEPDSDSIRQLTSVEGQADVAWSPDGQRLLIWSQGGGLTHVLLLDPVGQEEPSEPLGGPLAGGLGGFAWSPESTRIAYVGSGKANVLNVADGRTTTIAEDVGSGISWAPDGTHLAYSTGAGNDVVVVGADGSDRLVVASLGLNPQWMPDGQRLIFSRRQEAYPQETSGSIAMIPAAGGPIEEIASGFPLDVSSDGKLAAVRKNEDGSWEIEVFDLAAGGSRVVSGQVDAWGEGSFSPDGAQLLFRSQDETSPGLYLVNVDGTGLRHLVQPTTGYAMFGEWSPDSRFVAFVVSSGGFCEG